MRCLIRIWYILGENLNGPNWKANLATHARSESVFTDMLPDEIAMQREPVSDYEVSKLKLRLLYVVKARLLLVFSKPGMPFQMISRELTHVTCTGGQSISWFYWLEISTVEHRGN